MRYVSITQAFLGLLVAAPLIAGYPLESTSEGLIKRNVGGLAAFVAKMVRTVVPSSGLETRHHTEAQIAAKNKAAKEKAAKKKAQSRDAPAPDEFGPWDSTEDEFGSWLDKREPHHTEAQIAAKEKAAKEKAVKKKGQTRDVPAPDEFGPWDSAADEFGSWLDKREPHHTEAQIAAKKAAAAKSKACARNQTEVEAREPHHTEAQIAAKKAKAAKIAAACT